MDDLLWVRRWQRVMTYTRFVLLASLCVVCVYVVLVLRDVRRTVSVVPTKFDAATAQLNARADHLQDKLEGTLQNVNAILLQAGLAADQARLASQDQREFARTFDRKLNDTVDNVNRSITSVTADLHSTTADVHETLVGLPELVGELNSTVATANRVLSDPNIPRTLAGLSDTTTETALTMRQVEMTSAHLTKMSAEIEESLHARLHPKKRTLVLNTLWTVFKLGASAASVWK